MKTTVSVLLVCSLLWIPFQNLYARSLSPVPPKPQPQPEFVAECIVGLIIVGVAATICIGLKHQCDRLPSPPAPPAAPPPPPPVPPFIPPIILLHQISGGPANMECNFSDEGVQQYAVSQYDWSDTNGLPYFAFFKTTVQSSSDMVTWSDECSVQGYVSYGMCVSVVYDKNGNAMGTNACTMSGGMGTNTIQIQALGQSISPSRFYRLMSQP